MCLIAYRRANAGITIAMESLRTARGVNPDGWGIMWSDGSRLHIKKGFDESWEEVWNAIPGNYPSAIHFRYATGGGVSRDNLHPFLVLSGKGKRKDNRATMALGLMHNGILPYAVAKASDNKSDTNNFVSELREVLRHDPALVRRELFQTMLTEYIGGGNKFLFMESTGKVHILGEKRGSWMVDPDTKKAGNDVWLSNTYSFNQTHRTPKPSSKTPAQPSFGYEGFDGYGPYTGGGGYGNQRNYHKPPANNVVPYVGGDQSSRKTVDTSSIPAKQANGRSEEDTQFAITICHATLSQGGTLTFNSDQNFNIWLRYLERQEARKASKVREEEAKALEEANNSARKHLESMGVAEAVEGPRGSRFLKGLPIKSKHAPCFSIQDMEVLSLLTSVEMEEFMNDEPDLAAMALEEYQTWYGEYPATCYGASLVLKDDIQSGTSLN